jgi:hypothetical protein
VEAFQRADRRQHDRQPHPAAELLDRGIDPAHIAQHPRPERDGVQRHAVAPERGLGLGRAGDVVPVVLVEVLPRLGDDLVQIEKLRRSRRVMQGRLLGLLIGHRGIQLGRRWIWRKADPDGKRR